MQALPDIQKNKLSFHFNDNSMVTDLAVKSLFVGFREIHLMKYIQYISDDRLSSNTYLINIIACASYELIQPA